LHPAAKQIGYQVEVQVMAHCCTLCFFLDRPKADLHKYNHKDVLAVALENYFLAPFTAVLSVAPALNAGAFEALILIASPVLGLRPFLAARFFTEKVYYSI
jgi:hypothetical protein